MIHIINLKLHYGPAFTSLTKINNEVLKFDDALTLNELFDYFIKKYGDKFKDLIWDKKNKENFHDQLVIIINGKTYRDENFINTTLKDGDDLSFLYVYFGG